jgi:MFS family permease
MAATDGLAVTPQQLVERERPVRSKIGLVALATAILTVVANIVQNAALSDRPPVTEIDALRDAAGQPLGRPGLGTDQVLFFHDHAASILIGSVLQALVSLGVGAVLVTLLAFTLDRGGRAPRFARELVIVGAVAAALGTVMLTLGLVLNANDFASAADHGTQAAHDAARSGFLVVAGTVLGLVGLFPLAAGFVMIAIAAMRIGLLTRFVGVLGAIVGVLQILGPLSAGAFVVNAFWLAMVGALMLGRWPSGMPPAWEAGEAVPWPTQQEIREERERQRAAGGGSGRRGRGRGSMPAPASDPEPVVEGTATEAASPATSARKKRKRRG